MEEFHVIQPSPLLVPYIKHYWFLKTSEAAEPLQRIIPTGNSCMVFHRATNMFSVPHNQMQPKAFITGQSGGYYDLMQSGTVDMISVVFQPHGAIPFFSIPMHELQEMTVSVDDIHDTSLTELRDRLIETVDTSQCVRLIESYLLKRLYMTKAYNFQRISSTIRAIDYGQTDINQLAQTCCLSYKQFKRIFNEYIGTNPKDFLRIIRFQRALYMLQTNPQLNFTRLSAECDYFDQSHLIKDFKTFSGYTPSEYISMCAPYSDYFY